jgi:protocatechuate 3,4-dioxygenase beta subunit
MSGAVGFDVFAPIAPGTYPPNATPAYRSSTKRAPRAAPIAIPVTPSEATGPDVRGPYALAQRSAACPVTTDLTRLPGRGEALGQRIIVHGRVTDEYDRPERNALLEVWQANAAGRYRHHGDTHDAPLDPNFDGGGALLTDADGHYAFTTIEPGIYPWANHHNAWRPKHIHFSLFGSAWATRLVTQMYFPGDPTLPFDPIFMALTDAAVRARLVARFDLDYTRPDFAIAYRFDIVLRGRRETPWERTP